MRWKEEQIERHLTFSYNVAENKNAPKRCNRRCSWTKKIGEVSAGLRRSVRDESGGPARITLDMDSPVITVYGKQQRAKVGYNPKKPGRKSYHPLLCFVGETRNFLWGRRR